MSLKSSGGKPKMQFYRRPLPETCIDFASHEGRHIFQEALNAGHMTCFFKLSAQFRTQDEPAYCGLTSLVMALNVLEIDPGRIWKGPWRWYHEDMLDCCISLDVVKEKGINMDQFVCLAKCNNLAAELMCALHFNSINDLRALIKKKVQVDNEVMVISYSRAILKQTGSGHFSPIAGYHEGRDLVLILDTARFKYPPHWVPLNVMMEAMQATDSDTGHPRGIVLLSRTDIYVGTLLYRLACSFVVSAQRGILSPQLRMFSQAWNSWLDEHQDLENGMPQSNVFIRQFVQIVEDCLQDISLFCLIMQSSTSGQCDSLCCVVKCKNVSKGEEKEIRCAYVNLLKELENLQTYQLMRDVLSLLPDERRIQLMKLVKCSEIMCLDKNESTATNDGCVYQSCQGRSPKRLKTLADDDENSSISLTITPENIMTILFLVWPINTGEPDKGTRREWMNGWIEDDLQGVPKRTIRQEVVALHVKIVEVLNYHFNDASKAFSLTKCLFK